jgi:hypothetical protein
VNGFQISSGAHENLDAVLCLKDLNVLVHRDFPEP